MSAFSVIIYKLEEVKRITNSPFGERTVLITVEGYCICGGPYYFYPKRVTKARCILDSGGMGRRYKSRRGQTKRATISQTCETVRLSWLMHAGFKSPPI